MKPTNICEQLKQVSEKLNTMKASDTDSAEDAFTYLRHCEMETMMLYDEIKGEVLRIISEEVSDEEFKKKMDYAIEKLIGH